jgi:hypothetical protein
VTVDCPFDCEHLREARRHEKPAEISPEDVPNQEIELDDRFLHNHGPLVMRTGHAVLQAAMETQGAVDFDVREALESMIKTQRTLESGLIYESRPDNPYAANIQQRVRQQIEEFREQIAKEMGMHSIRDADVLGALVFLQRVELQRNNGRRRGRAFLDFLFQNFPPPEPEPREGLLATP